MDIETRVKNLEDMLVSVMKNISNNKFYTDADVAGVRKGVSDVTPWEMTKTAYIEDHEIVFENVPEGDISIFIDNRDVPEYVTDIDEHRNFTIHFLQSLEEVAKVTIKVL